MIKRFLLLLTLISGLTAIGQAQNITISEQAAISQMMQRFVEINRSKVAVDGWRIQLLATTDRTKLDSALRNFQSRYPNIAVDWVHERPYYKLRAGAFTSKLAATRVLYSLKRDYPSAYPAQDKNIRPQELAGYY